MTFISLSTCRVHLVRCVLLFLIFDHAVSQAQQTSSDPINDYCRRFAHQTTVIDRKLFIDGGFVDYGGSVYPSTTNDTNTYLLYLDLDDIGQYNFPLEYANLSKPSYVPSVHGGILWADTVNKVFYLFGGEYNWTTPPPAQFTLWEYDAIYDKWNATSPDSTASGIQSVSFGAGTVVDDRALAYYYGGWLSNSTVLGWNGNPIAQSGLIQYDMLNNVWQNNTFIDGVPRAEGNLYYIPASDQGMLLYIGGVEQTSNGSYSGVSMNQTYLYDIASGKYYTQTTSGTAPPMRRRFCGGVSWPNDQSSYNIYFYGGLPPNDQEGLGYGDVWILSIPSFTWIQWYPSSSEHHSLSCNVIDGSQMIIMGGYFPNSSNIGCDAKNIWGQHNLNLGEDNYQNAEWYQYLPNVTSYQVPTNITDVIGGGPLGGATLTTAAAGWDNPDLQTYFTRKYVSSTRTPTRALTTATSSAPAPPPPAISTHAAHKTNVGAIAGGAAGGGAVLLALITLGICLRRRSKRRQASSRPQQSGPMTELPAPQNTGHDIPLSQHKRTFTGSSAPVVSPMGSPPPPPFNSDHWQQQAQQQPQQYYASHQAPQAVQQYYPPPQAQQYYPPPPEPEQHEEYPSPIVEMPSVRSPMRVRGLASHRETSGEE